MTMPDKPTDTPAFQVKGFGAFLLTMLVITGFVDLINWVAGAIVH